MQVVGWGDEYAFRLEPPPGFNDKDARGCGEEMVLDKGSVEFHVNISYEKRPCVSVSCARCGGDKFHVGLAYVFTAIKCVNCGWERSVHEG